MENKKSQAKEVYDLQKALVHFSEVVGDTEWSDKSERERRISTLANALLMQLHLLVEEQGLEGKESCSVSPTEQLADKFLQVSNAIRNSEKKIEPEIVDNFNQAIDLFDIAREAKEAGKTMAIKDKYKNI